MALHQRVAYLVPVTVDELAVTPIVIPVTHPSRGGRGSPEWWCVVGSVMDPDGAMGRPTVVFYDVLPSCGVPSTTREDDAVLAMIPVTFQGPGTAAMLVDRADAWAVFTVHNDFLFFSEGASIALGLACALGVLRATSGVLSVLFAHRASSFPWLRSRNCFS